MERLDKVISNYTEYSRSEVKVLIKQRRVKINNEFALKPEIKVDINKDKIYVDESEITIREKVYLVLNKPKGYITATEDKNAVTVLDLIGEEYRVRDIFPVGRLDKDTTGLLLITNDGEFAHNVIAPKKDKEKIYEVKIDIPVNDDMRIGFEKGVVLNDGKCKPAKLKKISEYEALVTITEGRYHQIKRMFGCFGAKVVELKRIQIAGLKLPEDLKEGEYRELTEDELSHIFFTL